MLVQKAKRQPTMEVSDIVIQQKNLRLYTSSLGWTASGLSGTSALGWRASALGSAVRTRGHALLTDLFNCVFNLALACGSKGLPTENRLGYCSVGKRPVKVRSGYPDVLGNGDHWFVGWPEMVLFLCSFFIVGVRNRGNGCNGVGMAVNR